MQDASPITKPGEILGGGRLFVCQAVRRRDIANHAPVGGKAATSDSTGLRLALSRQTQLSAATVIGLRLARIGGQVGEAERGPGEPFGLRGDKG